MAISNFQRVYPIKSHKTIMKPPCSIIKPRFQWPLKNHHQRLHPQLHPQLSMALATHGLQLERLVHVAHIGAGLFRGAAREGQDLRLPRSRALENPQILKSQNLWKMYCIKLSHYCIKIYHSICICIYVYIYIYIYQYNCIYIYIYIYMYNMI